VRVLLEVAVDAVHALLGVDVHQMDGLLELVGIVGADDLAAGVEQRALPVLLVDVPEHPAVPWKSANCVRVSFGFRSVRSEERRIGPLAAERRCLGIPRLDVVDLLLGVGFCSFSGYMSAPSVSLSHHMVPK